MTASIEELANDIKAIHRSAPKRARELIEAYLLEKTPELDVDRRLVLLESLRRCFAPKDVPGSAVASEPLDRLRGLLADVLGKPMDESMPSTDVLVSQLSASLNRIFDALNEIVGVLHGTLLGEQEELQTIRRLLHTDLLESRSTGAIEQYLSQIKRAFLLSNRAFHLAARSQLKKVLDELDPDRTAPEQEHGFKFGFLKKSDQIEEFRSRFERVRKWFESDRFTEDLSREFERICQKLFAEKGE